MDNETIIKVDNVSKTFRLPHEKTTSVKSAVINFYRRKRSYEKQQALKGVSLEVKKGEFFGIVGRNGSGKSTLLKILAGIYEPSSGSTQVNGKLTPFIELGVGFNMELTGRENIFLNGSLLGFNRKEMHAMYDDIVEFAELAEFMDQKLKNYSSGMQVRLAFSIAIRVNSDILLIDEVLAVGDASFQQKCFDVFAELKKKGVTIILVTHDMGSVLRFCDRAVMIDKGLVVDSGEPMEVADAYLELNYGATENYKKLHGKASDKDKTKTEDKSKPTIASLELQDSKGHESHELNPGEKCRVSIAYNNPKALPIHFGIQIFSEGGVYCFGTNSKVAGLKPIHDKKGNIVINFSLDLVPGTYYFTAATMNENATTVFDYKSKIKKFRIVQSTQVGGVALLENIWEQ